MTYILIAMYIFNQKATSVVVEFNSLPACQAAATEVQKQQSMQVVLCAAKGEKK